VHGGVDGELGGGGVGVGRGRRGGVGLEREHGEVEGVLGGGARVVVGMDVGEPDREYDAAVEDLELVGGVTVQAVCGGEHGAR
jgi:hypothetical protein